MLVIRNENTAAGQVDGGQTIDGIQPAAPQPISDSEPSQAVVASERVGYLREVLRQTAVMLKKTMILAYRNRTATMLRIFVSFFFLLVTFFVNSGLKRRYDAFPYFQDLKVPSASSIEGIPQCNPPKSKNNCLVFAYSPAGMDEYLPAEDFAKAEDYATSVRGNTPQCDTTERQGRPICDETDCQHTTSECAKCCELFRIHKVVRAIMARNGSGSHTISSDQVMGFHNEKSLDEFMMLHQDFVQGAFLFSSPSTTTTTFVVQRNSTPSQIRNIWQDELKKITLPMQVAATRGIAEALIENGTNIEMAVSVMDFAHPAAQSASFEGQTAPLFLLACAMFPFVIQMAELTLERELRLRQALSAMGLHDLALWLSWHLYQSGMSLLGALLLTAFGCLVQLDIFLKNDFGVVWLSFWLFAQALAGLAFFVASFLRRSAQAVTVGMVAFLTSFLLYCVVAVFAFPFGLYGTMSFSYERSVDESGWVYKTNGDQAYAPLFALLPFSLLIRVISDLGALSADEAGGGIRMASAYSYCTFDKECDPAYSVGKCWEWFVCHYVAYSLLALYLDNVLPDAMGVRKPPWYFLSAKYWWFGSAAATDQREVIEASTDEDVLEEEEQTAARAGGPMDDGSAVEVRGLVQAFRRGGKPLLAVKAPWFSCGKRQLFALLGPNGAGKTTTINMLVGALPPSRGNALVMGHTVAHPNGITQVRKVIGVCPQFDTLWGSLTAREHMELFGAIKGVRQESLAAAAERGLEQVRLQECQHATAGTYSGGMRRRLSVAIALIGNPQVLFLDEPTTGMDPISRRHVWDVIEAAKQDRCVILTTHSMEEADILGDRIAIMAKGRLRCIGSSVRLKMKYGAGYKVSVQLKGGGRTETRREVRELLCDVGGARFVEDSRGYMHFEAPAGSEEKMAEVFASVEGKREALEVEAIHLGMSSLEDVFLRIAKESEIEAARRDRVECKVTLQSGESAMVLVGDEEEQTAGSGLRFRVVWGTDESGNLIPWDTVEHDSAAATPGREDSPGPSRPAAGTTAPVEAGRDGEGGVQGAATEEHEEEGGPTYDVEGGRTGPVEQGSGVERGAGQPESKKRGRLDWTRDEVKARVDELNTPFSRRTYALMRKNASYQATRRVTNCCLVVVPMIILGLLLALQWLIEDTFLKEVRFRCPYCGPSDDFARFYCAGNSDCVSYFFPKSKSQEFENRYGVDVNAQCRQTSLECGGGGNISCFHPEWASATQIAWCPYEFGVTKPLASYMTPPMRRSETPVLFTGGQDGVAEAVVSRLFRGGGRERALLRGVGEAVTDALFAMLAGLPLLGCAGEGQGESLLSREEEEGVCAVLRRGLGGEGLCCIDMSDGDDPLAPDATGPLVAGVNYWSPRPQEHNDGNYSASVEACMARGHSRVECHREVVVQWEADGVRFASGDGREKLSRLIGALGSGGLGTQPTVSIGALLRLLAESGARQFRCVQESLPAAVEAQLAKSGECVPLEEGIAILAQSMRFNASVHPSPEPFRDIPDCIGGSNCQVWEGQWAKVCAGHTRELEDALQTGALGGVALEKLAAIPCACRWSLVTKLWSASALFPTAPLAVSTPDLPSHPTCRARPGGGISCDAGKSVNAFALSSLHWATPIFHRRSLLDERPFAEDDAILWNQQYPDLKHFEAVQAGDNASNPAGSRGAFRIDDRSWERITRMHGNLSLVAANCSAVAAELCWLRKVSNLSGIDLGCVEARAERIASASEVYARLYDGFWNRFEDGDQQQEEFLMGLDFRESTAGPRGRLDVAVMLNNTTPFRFGPPRMLRIPAPLRAVLDAYVQHRAGDREINVGMVGLREMPKPATQLSLDLGGTVGPFFLTLAFSLLFPTIVVALVYEKEMRLRVMMEMMGLGRAAYWLINYLFWLIVYAAFTLVFLAVAYTARLPSGYTIGIITRQAGSIHFIFFLFLVNHTIAFAFLWASLLSSARNAQIAATLWVLAMSLVAWTTWDGGNYFNADDVPEAFKTILTLFPIWGAYRGFLDYAEYGFQAARKGTDGLQWSDLNDDPRVGMDTVLVTLAVESVLFLIVALYLDQVLHTGHGVSAHPLFFLGFKAAVDGEAKDEEATADESTPDDVREEAERVRGQGRGEGAMSAVLVDGIRKEFARSSRAEHKVAVDTLTMGVEHGECFGLLGPNGAGKTSLINMLVGFMPPTRGSALVEGFDVRREMSKIYTIMGVCPQHDILWESLTARQHMMFYGRLKNLDGRELAAAVADGLRAVQLLSVADEAVGTFSGGMKRRLSVAVALVGRPLCCYLDEPSTGLDPASRRTLWRAVTNAKRSGALLLTTHSMEEAEGLCDRIGIFVSGRLRCVGEPKALAARFGGAYTLTITSSSSAAAVSGLVHSFAPDARVTYSLAGTHKYEFPTSTAALSTIFRSIAEGAEQVGLRDWGISNTTLEEAFIKIAKNAT